MVIDGTPEKDPQTLMCQCEGTLFVCRHHERGKGCGMPARLLGWATLEERSADHSSEKGAHLCHACAGAAIGKGWFLRSYPGR